MTNPNNRNVVLSMTGNTGRVDPEMTTDDIIAQTLEQARLNRLREVQMSELELMTAENKSRVAKLKQEARDAENPPPRTPAAPGAPLPVQQDAITTIADILIKMTTATMDNNKALTSELREALKDKVAKVVELKPGMGPDGQQIFRQEPPKTLLQQAQELQGLADLFDSFRGKNQPQGPGIADLRDITENSANIIAMKNSHELAMKKLDLEIEERKADRAQREVDAKKSDERLGTVFGALSTVGRSLAQFVGGKIQEDAAAGQPGGPGVSSQASGAATDQDTQPVARMLCVVPECKNPMMIPFDAIEWSCIKCGKRYAAVTDAENVEEKK